jgi:hypothetical protein
MTPDSATAPTETSETPADGGTTPGPTRYRCAACGNLTRFDVVTSRRTKAFHHYSVGGELSVEDVEVLHESVEEVSCRWCGKGTAIEVIEDGVSESA